MKNKNNIKLALDIIMVIIFVLIMTFSSESFHEIAGLGLGFAFLTHILINIQWVKKVTLRIFDSQLPSKTRFGYWLNLLLLVSLLLTITSGILISKVLFPSIGIYQGIKGIHSMMANFSLVLVGIHIGLHWEGIVSRTIQLFKAKPFKIFGNVTVFIIVLFLLFGGYQSVSHQILITSSTDSTPISSQQQVQQNQNYVGSRAVLSPDNNVINNSDKQPPRTNGRKEHDRSNPIGVIFYPAIIIAIALVTRSLRIRLFNK